MTKETEKETARTISEISWYIRENGDMIIEGIAVSSGMKSDGLDLTEDSIYHKIKGFVGNNVVFNHSDENYAVVGEIVDASARDIKSGIGKVKAVIWGETAKRFIKSKKLNALSAKFVHTVLPNGRSNVQKFGHLCLSDMSKVVDTNAVITSFRTKDTTKEGDNMDEKEALRANVQLTTEKGVLEKDLETVRTKVTDLEKDLEDKSTKLEQFVEREKEWVDKDKELVALREERKTTTIKADLDKLEGDGNTLPAQREKLEVVLSGLYEIEGQYKSMVEALRTSKVVEFRENIRADNKPKNTPELTKEEAAARYGISV